MEKVGLRMKERQETRSLDVLEPPAGVPHRSNTGLSSPRNSSGHLLCAVSHTLPDTLHGAEKKDKDSKRGEWKRSRARGPTEER